jgi:RNA polymerase sigma factor (sigma-70 family)
VEHLELAADPLVTHKASSFEDLFRSEYPSVHRAVLRLVGENGRAEEIAAEVFVKLLERPVLFRSDHIAAWLHRSALNAALDDLRKQRTRNGPQMLSGIEERDPSPHALLERSERARQVRSVLSTMRSRDVRLLIAKSMDLSYERIAEITGVKKSSVGTLLARAQSTFEQRYRRKYGSD